MALILPLTLEATNKYDDNGVLVDIPEQHYPAAYARLFSVRVFTGTSYLLVCWYADEAARFADAAPVKMWEYLVPTADLKGDVYPAAYAYLKTLEEFAGALDHPVTDPAELPAVNSPPAVA